MFSSASANRTTCSRGKHLNDLKLNDLNILVHFGLIAVTIEDLSTSKLTNSTSSKSNPSGSLCSSKISCSRLYLRSTSL